MESKTRNYISELKIAIPNVTDFFSEDQIDELIDDELKNEDIETIVEGFVDAIWDMEYRRCTMCGRLMREGYVLGDDYACSDECMHNHYKTFYVARDDEEAEKFYQLEFYEIADDDSALVGSFTDEDKEEYEIDKRPQQMTLDELNKFIDEKIDSDDIGEYVYYTEWY